MFRIALLAALFADPNVVMTSGHQEAFVKVTSFAGCNSVANACALLTTLYPHRSFAASSSTDTDLALVIVPPGGTLSGASIAPIYIRNGWTRVVDNGSDQVVLPAGSLIYYYYTGVIPGSGNLVLDQLF